MRYVGGMRKTDSIESERPRGHVSQHVPENFFNHEQAGVVIREEGRS